MKPKLYLETTIPSYLTAWPSRDLVKAAKQQITREWWKERRHDFDLFVSEIVLDEAGQGDPQAARLRLESLQGIPALELDRESISLGQVLVDEGPLPKKAVVDSLHIAVATVNGMGFLLSWNCSHIANAAIRGEIEDLCRSRDYEPPIICTPDELFKE